MVIQYPDEIIVSVKTDSTQDANGDFIEGSSEDIVFVGRFELNTKGAFITGDNGKRIDHMGIFYGPVSVENIALGSSVQIVKGDGTNYTGSVQQFSRGQLNVRIWV